MADPFHGALRVRQERLLDELQLTDRQWSSRRRDDPDRRLMADAVSNIETEPFGSVSNAQLALTR